MDTLFHSPPTLRERAVTAPVSTLEETGDRSLLSRWFRVLHDRVRLADRHRLNSQNVRVGPSTADDWWIHVHPKGLGEHERCGFFGHHACRVTSDSDGVALFSELRDALLLTTWLARGDYDAWYEEMKLTSGLRLTEQQQEVHLECKFAFTLEADATPWRDKLTALWGYDDRAVVEDGDEFSEEFVSSARALYAMVKAKNVNWDDVIQPLPVRFEFSGVAATPEAQGAVLNNVTDDILYAQQSSTKNILASRSVLPSFKLQNVELYLWRHDAHPAVFHALERLVDTNVPINFLALPGRYDQAMLSHGELCESWHALVQKLFRSSGSTASVAVQIDRLEISSVYLTPAMSVPWLPAVATATNVRSLSIQGQTALTLATSLFWRHLGRAFFRQHSSSSIQSLELAGLSAVTAGAIAEFEHVSALGGQESDEPAHSAVRTLVLRIASGYQPAVDGSPFLGPKQWISRILERACRTLTVLAIDTADIDDAMLDQCLRACPNLESLRINGAVLQSLDALVDVYDRPEGRRLISIDLRNITIPIDAFETFLKSLGDSKRAIGSTLTRLRIGEGWSSAFRKSTVTALEDLFNANTTLAIVHVYRSAGPFSSIPVTDWNGVMSHDGCFLPGTDRPLALESRFTFLGSLQALIDSSALPFVGVDLLKIIMELAATARRRSIVVFTDDQIQYSA